MCYLIGRLHDADGSNHLHIQVAIRLLKYLASIPTYLMLKEYIVIYQKDVSVFHLIFQKFILDTYDILPYKICPSDTFGGEKYE